MNFDIQLLNQLKAEFPESVIQVNENEKMPFAEIKASDLKKVCERLKKDKSYDMQQCISISGVHQTSTDDENIILNGFEVIYHFYSYHNNKGITIKVKLPEENPNVDSIDDIWYSANWFERETYDFFGIQFNNSRDLRRIMLPEDWEGYPLRKDYKEKEEYNGMSTSREDELAKKEISLRFMESHTQDLDFEDIQGNLVPVSSEEMELNMGPHHPATHGVIRMILKMDGEIIKSAKPDVGYLHRSIEKIAEKMTYQGFMPYTDRIDYLASVNCNVGYAIALEEMASIEVPQRAQYLRLIACEMIRISSHLLGAGSMTMDMGAYTPFTHAIREREALNDFMEIMCGARLTHNYARIGGVSQDVNEDFLKKLDTYLDHFLLWVDELDRLISFNKIYIQRTKDIGIISEDEAMQYCFSGPNLRASGVNWDIRKNEPYLVYDKIDFDVIVGKGYAGGSIGDSFDRYYCRIEEMRQSAKIIKQALSQIPDGEISAKVPKKFVLPEGEIYSRTEAPRGELGYYIVSDGKSQNPYRLKIRTGSFAAMTSVEEMFKGMMIADAVAYFASLDVVAPEIDR